MDRWKFILEKPSGDMITHSVKADTEDEAYDKVSAKNLGRVREVKRTTNVYGYQAELKYCDVYDLQLRIEAEFEGEHYDLLCRYDVQQGKIIDMDEQANGHNIPDVLWDRIQSEVQNASFEYEFKIQ